MAFGDIFKRASFGKKGVAPREDMFSLHPAMSAELRRLDLFKPDLGAQAIRYVALGSDAGVLDTIAASGKATPVHTTLFYRDSEGKSTAERATNLALARGEIDPGAHVARLMMVRYTVQPSYLYRFGQTIAPGEVPVIALCAALDVGIHASQVGYSTPWETIVPVHRLLDLMVGVGGGVRDLFAFILRRTGTEFIVPGSWQESEALAALARAHPADFAAALLGESERRRAALKLTEHHKLGTLPEVTAALLALLTKPYRKDDRELAAMTLARMESAALLRVLENALPTADIDTRLGLVQAAGRNGAPELVALLGERDKVEKAAKVKAAIQALREAAGSQSAAPDQGAGYAAIDDSFVAIPPAPELGGVGAPSPSDEDCDAFMACIEAISARRAEQLAKHGSANPEHVSHLQPLTRDEIEATFEMLTEGTPLPRGITRLLAWELRSLAEFRTWYDGLLDRLPFAVALRSMRGAGYGELSKIAGYQYFYNDGERWATTKLREWLETGRCGIREIIAADRFVHEALVAGGNELPPFDPVAPLRKEFSQSIYGNGPATYESAWKELPSEAVWPWLANNLQIFDEALGLRPTQIAIPLNRAIAVLELLPAVPQRYLARLIELAVTENRALRRRIRAVLRPAKGLDQRIEALLDDARQQVRANAASWLADIRAPGGETAMRKRLKKEKSDPVRTALIEALKRLGADLSDVIGPASLIAEAAKAAEKGVPELPEWLAGAGLPIVRFADGATLPESVLRHWLALAIRLKDPGATGQFGIYLDQLDPADAATLSGWVLESWINFDTQTASLEDANAYAAANYTKDWRWLYQAQTTELRDEIIADMRRQKLGEMLNSGSDTKGVLALACRADPVWAANRVRWYLKKHGRRSNQAMALLDLLAGIGAPAALQVVIAASARLKQKSTQARAAEIAERYAEDRGWSFDELADRTVPAAGFDDDGVLELPCGPEAKPYSARLDAALAIHLFNPEGKPIKALPAGDDDTSNESQKALSAAKKELKQVVELQAARLFEAMCAERSWPVADWRDAFHAHPVMRRLVERLVWQGLDADGAPLGLFRPTQEGDFTDAADEAVDVDTFARLRLAHGALCDAATCQAWIAHLKDYAVSPFLSQFDALRAPLPREMANAEQIADRQGWVAESLTYRGVVEKRGYARVMGDGGGCQEYVKSFPVQGISATIHHSGSNAQDENNRIALKQLSFTRVRHNRFLALHEVPPVIRGECWADYHATAAKGAFDPEWKSFSW